MSEYDILNNLNNPTPEYTNNNVPNEPEKKPNYIMAFLAGFGTSVIVGIVLALLGIWAESEYMIALIIGAVIVAAVIKIDRCNLARIFLYICVCAGLLYAVLAGRGKSNCYAAAD